MWLIDFIPIWIFHITLLISIFVLVFAPIISWIPVVNTYRTPIQYLFTALLGLCLFIEGTITANESWKQKVAKLEVENAKLETKAAEKTVEVVTNTITEVEKVRGKTIEIIKEIPIYITKTDDANCIIPDSFNQLHNAAAKNEIPDPTTISNAGTKTPKIAK